jgi:glycosyltransferase involved in cell wall biosynthesis
MPTFSVLVPTRDRPDLLGFCLEGLALQTLPDVEVIVADNPVHAPARDVFERWCRDGWRFVSAPTPLAMHENWEFGLQHATGDFVAVVIDKTILHPSALEIANRVLEHDPGADLVSWWNDAYYPVDEVGQTGKGVLVAGPDEARDAERFDPSLELQKMYSLEQRRGEDHIHYYRGKIPFGAYSRALLARIHAACGRVFYPLTPDYTSRIAALALARGAVDIGRPLLVSYISARSNGHRSATYASYAKSFVVGAAPNALQDLPIPGLYASQHNVVAHDYVTSARRLAPESLPDLNRENLVRRAREDLELVEWDSLEERDEQYGILEAEEARLGVLYVPPDEPPEEPLPDEPPSGSQRFRSAGLTLLERIPPAERAARWALRRPVPELPPPPPIYASPVEAAVVADRRYTSVGGGINL